MLGRFNLFSEAVSYTRTPFRNGVPDLATQKLLVTKRTLTIVIFFYSPLLASSESGSTRHQQASEMFQGLESHSVLHVLHKSVSLAHLPEKEVFELLRKRPVFSPLDANQTSSCPTEVMEERLIEKEQAECEDASKEKTEKGGQDSEIHPEVQRDIFLYHSYCALRNFMEAITSSVEETSVRDSLETVGESADEKTARTLAPGRSERVDETPGIASQQQSSCGQVANKLAAGKQHLAQVYPLTYRVEVLENIFSLLFGTYEDLYEGRVQQNESDDLETMDEETKSLSKSSRTGSWESLASSVDLSFDGAVPHSSVKDQEKTSSPASSMSPTSDAQQRHKDASTPSALDSVSRRQLFKNTKSESDSTLLSKVINGEERSGIFKSQDATEPVNTRQSENDSLSGNLHSSKGSSRAAPPDENDLKCEFVVDDEIVPDLLKTLKECLMELNTAKFSELKKGSFWK